MERGNDSDQDIISDLPLNVLESILVFLPIRDAVRTSILSTKWRYKWTTIPQLVFDDECIIIPSNNHALLMNKLVNFVDRVLLLHKGPIQKFKLSISYMLSCSDIDQWILYLSRNDIKEFSLDLEEKEWYKIPSCLFNCQQLTHLEFSHCEFIWPLKFKGFRNLKYLSLKESYFESDDIEYLIANCPLLESFTFTSFDTISLSIKVCAPSLKYLRLEGEFMDIFIENAPHLETVSVALYMTDEIADHLDQITTSNMVKALGSVPVLERLVAESYFVKYLSVGYVPSGFPNKYNHLKKIELFQVGFEDVNEISVVTCLLMNSPNLEQLLITAFWEFEACVVSPNIDFRLTQHLLSCSFNQLQIVKMIDVSGVPNELEFIKFVLAKSPALKSMTVKPSLHVIDCACDMLIRLLQFPRASTQAGVTYINT